MDLLLYLISIHAISERVGGFLNMSEMKYLVFGATDAKEALLHIVSKK